MARKQAMKPMRDEDIPVYVALGRKIAEQGTGTERQKQNARLWAEEAQRRDQAWDADPTMGRPAADVLRDARARLK